MPRSNRPARRIGAAVLLVVVLAVIGGVAGAVSAAVRGATYTSEVQYTWDPSVDVQIDPNYVAVDADTFNREVADQQDVILSDAVAGKAAATLGLTATQLRNDITVTTTAGSSVIVLDVTGTSAASAERSASAVSSAYLAALKSQNTALVADRLTTLTAAITSVQRQITASKVANVQGQLATQLATLVGQQATLTAAQSDVPVEASPLRTADLPTSPSSFSVGVSLLIGAALGAIVAIVIVVLRTPRREELSPYAERPYAPAQAAPVAQATAAPAVPAPAAPAAAPAASTAAKAPAAAPAPKAAPAEADAKAKPADADEAKAGDGAADRALSPSSPSYFD